MDSRQVTNTPGDWEPSIPPPPGVVSNLQDPPNWQWATIFAMVLYIVTTTVLLGIRMYTRIKVHMKLWWDDYCMVLGWIGLVTFAGLMFESLKFGNATNEWNVSKAHAAHLRQLFSTIEIVARLGIFFTKTGILLLYLRYFCPRGTHRTAVWWWTWAVIIFNFLYCVALILTVTLQCVGKHHNPGQNCVNSWAVLIGASIINVITDLIMLAIPISVVWNLHVDTARKFGLWIMFSFAGLAVAASVARLSYQIPQANSPNQTILITRVGILALAEHAIGIIVGCMPLLPSFYAHLRKHLRSTSPATRPSMNENKYQMKQHQTRLHGKYNDTTLMATEHEDLHDIESLRLEDSDHNSDQDVIAAVATRKSSTVVEHSSEPRPPSAARLPNERNHDWPLR